MAIRYAGRGITSIDELGPAVIKDVHAVKDIYNIHYGKPPGLTFIATNTAMKCL